jgi:anti-sigma factor RsiW
MKCRQVDNLADAYADGEVHGLLGCSIERHVAACAACAGRQARIAALRASIRRDVPYFVASEALHSRARALVEAVRASVPAQPRRARRPWPWLGGGALAGVAATLFAWTVGTTLVASRLDDQLANEAVAMHVRASLNQELVQVASSDRHTVKPWLSARLDYSPPVRDYAKEGFPLLGGRLASMERRPVAALVYRHGEHTIDVFVCPEAPEPATSAVRTVRGFNVAHARGATMDWIVVSDVEPAVLSAFVQRLAREEASE